MKSIEKKRYVSISFYNNGTKVFFYLHFGGIKHFHLYTNGFKPNAEGYIYTIPHLETVAGDATAKSYT